MKAGRAGNGRKTARTGVHHPLQRWILVLSKQQRGFGKSVMLGVSKIPVKRHLRVDPRGRIEAERKHDFRLVVDAVAFRMPEATPAEIRQRKILLEDPLSARLSVERYCRCRGSGRIARDRHAAVTLFFSRRARGRVTARQTVSIFQKSERSSGRR